MGIVGFTKKGPTDKATLVESFDEFTRRFGGLTDASLVPLSVQAFFENGGRRAYVVRVVPANSATAQALVDAVPGPVKWTIKAISPGSWGNDLQVRFEGDPDFLDTSGPLPVWRRFNVSVLEFDSNVGSFLTQEFFQSVSLTDPTDPAYLTTVINDDQRGSQLIRVIEGVGGVPNALLASAVTGEVIGTGDGVVTTFSGFLAQPRAFPGSVLITTPLTAQTVTDDGFGHLVGATISPAGLNIINYTTGEFNFTLTIPPAPGEPVNAAYTHLDSRTTEALTGGTDGVGVITRNQVTNPLLEVDKKGIYAFNDVEDILNIVIPDFAGDAQVMRDQADFADSKQDRFVILTTPPGLTPAEAIAFIRNDYQRNSRNTAIYYPWVKVLDRNTNGIKTIPPLGHIAGIYARTDLNRTVAKAPAGIDDGRFEGIFAIERRLERVDLDNLTVNRINANFSSETTGDIVFGARTGSLDPIWKFVNVRRTFIFVEKVLFRETQFAIFENNGPDLWARLNQAITGVLTSMFNAQMFAGATPEEAFFVVVDQSNNTPQDIENGVVNIDVGIAPLKPAEFILIRIQQKQVTPATT
jgi:phage tail sheath protein FI